MGGPGSVRRALALALALASAACSAPSRPAGSASDEAIRVEAQRSFCGHLDELARVLGRTLNRVQVTHDDVRDLRALERNLRDDATLYEAVRFSPAEGPDYPRLAEQAAAALGEAARTIESGGPVRNVTRAVQRVLEALFTLPERYCARAGLAGPETGRHYATMARTTFCLDVTRTGQLFEGLDAAAPPANAELAGQLEERRRAFELDRRLFLEAGDDAMTRVAGVVVDVLARWVAEVRAGGAALEELTTRGPELAAAFRRLPPGYCDDLDLGTRAAVSDAARG